MAYFALVLALCYTNVGRAAELSKGAGELLKPHQPSLMERIVPEERHAELGPRAAQFRAVPSNIKLCSTILDGKQLKVAVQQVSQGQGKRVLVLIHGVLSDHGTWRYIGGALAGEYELWLVDLPGCGLSEAPSPRALGPKGYCPTAMANRVLQALRECLAGREPGVELTIVAHSLGGMVSTQIAGNPQLKSEYDDVLRHLRSMVLFAPADMAINQENAVFVKIAKLHGYEINIAKALKILDYATAQANLGGVCETNRLARETAQNMARILGTKEKRQAGQAMIRQAVNWVEKEHRPDWDANKTLESHYANISVPCLIVWGERDQNLPESMGHKIKDHIPGARLLELPYCMHSPQAECPGDVVQIIREFTRPVPRIAQLDRSSASGNPKGKM